MDFDKSVDNLKDDIIKSTVELIKIKSVEDKKLPDKPFGEGVNEALEYALNLCSDMGFDTKNFDGYAGHAEFGESEEVVGILGHLDVVPEGDDWTYPPFGGEIHDNKIYGRGTIDDKGPMVACLYAMKILKESNVKLNKKVRIIFGTNEESRWEGINYYLSKEKAPDMAFTPDADFPVIHGEKGILIFDLIKKFSDMEIGDINIKSIKGGNRPNMVPDTCKVVLTVSDDKIEYVKTKLEEFVKENNCNLTIEEKDDEIVIISKGKSAHGSLPESGVNAVSQLMIFLSKLDICNNDLKDFIDLYTNKIGMEYNGQSIGCGFEDEDSGKLIFNVGVIRLDKSEAVVSVNIRYPITYDEKKVYAGLKDALEGHGIAVIEQDHMKPIYIPKDNILVNKLMNVYREATGDNKSEPITIGGGTYARAMKNAVAFGPLFPGQEELAHQKDENISIDDLIKWTKIYTKAIYELAK